MTISNAQAASQLGAVENRTAAEIAAGVTPTNFGYPQGYVLRYGTNTTPGTTDMTAAIQAANNVMNAAGGGVVVFPTGRIKTTAEITRSLKVSFQGQGRQNTIIEAAHNGKIFSCISVQVPPNVDDDQWAFVDGFSFTNSGGSSPAQAIYYANIAFTRVSDTRYSAGILVGEELHYVLNSRFHNINNTAATGTKIVSTSVSDGSNLNKFTEVAWSGNSTVQLSINGPGCYQNIFDTCCFFSAGAITVNHVYGARTCFLNCTWETNPANNLHLVGGDGILFYNCSQLDSSNQIDSASFGARNVVFEHCLGWNTLPQPPWIVNDEITVRDPTYTVNETAGTGNTDEAHYFTEGHSTKGRQFANFPSYAAGEAFYADSHITPLGGDIPTGSYNRVGSFDFSNAGQWTGNQGTSGATDPFGGTTAYNMNSIASSQHGGFGTGAAATGRTFTFQVWAKFAGRIRLGIGTTNLGIVKRANFHSSNANNWRLLSVTYTSGTDTGTTPLMNILTSQNAVMWRPCHYESFGPLPALQPNRNLASIVGPIRVEDTRITVFGDVSPAAGAFTIGDTTEKITPVVGNPKRWRCTVAGSPGTWVSEGNL